MQNTTAARYSVVIARPGHTTVAAGPYRSSEFADLVAYDIRHALGDEYPIVDVSPYEEGLLHLPGGRHTLRRLLAAIDGQPADAGVSMILAAAYTRHADRLRKAA